MDTAWEKASRKIADFLIEGPRGFPVVPVSPANPLLSGPDFNRKPCLLEEFQQPDSPPDILLFAAGAGVSPQVLFPNVVAQSMIHVQTSDLSSARCRHAQTGMLATGGSLLEPSIALVMGNGWRLPLIRAHAE